MLRRALAVVAGALVIAACGSGTKDDIPQEQTGASTSTSPGDTVVASSTTALESADVNADLKQRYAAFWEARFAANEAPVDPAAPALRELATGRQLDNVVAETQRRKDVGQAFRKPTRSVARRDIKIVEVDGDRATLQDCSVNDGIVYEVDTGKVVDDSVVTESVQATLTRIEGSWKVEDSRLIQRWEGIAGCAVSSQP